MVVRRQSQMRQAIYEAVLNHPVHPTAEYVYEQLKPQHPSLSLGTVYRNLGILAEQGLIRKIESQSGADRFDGNVEPHFHVRCRECGRLEDVFLSYDGQMDAQVQATTGYRIEEHFVTFSGLCKRTIKRNPKSVSFGIFLFEHIGAAFRPYGMGA